MKNITYKIMNYRIKPEGLLEVYQLKLARVNA